MKSGEEGAFVQEWTEFVSWASSMPGSGTFRLVRDLEHPEVFADGLHLNEKGRPMFSERLGKTMTELVLGK